MRGGLAAPDLPEGDVMDEKKIDHEVSRRRQLHDRNVHDVVSLLERRQELRGIYPMADLVAENVGWLV
jgi:hypothetical protein